MTGYRQVRLAGWRATPPPCCRGSTWPPARSARACRSASAWPWPASTSTSCRTGSGCCAATARWPRGRSGRRSTRPPIYHLDNLTAIVDVNRLGQRGPTELRLGPATRTPGGSRRSAGTPIDIDGHDLGEIDEAFSEAWRTSGPAHRDRGPTARAAGVSEVEDREGWHGKPLPEQMAERAIAELGGERHLLVSGAAAGGRDAASLARRRR